MSGLHDELIEITDKLDEYRKRYIEATDIISECDRLEQDLLHEVELGDMGYHGTAKLAKELRYNRIRRRIAKDTVVTHTDYYKLTCDGQFKHIVSSLRSAARKSLAESNKLKDRKYTKRVDK